MLKAALSARPHSGQQENLALEPEDLALDLGSAAC